MASGRSELGPFLYQLQPGAKKQILVQPSCETSHGSGVRTDLSQRRSLKHFKNSSAFPPRLLVDLFTVVNDQFVNAHRLRPAG